MDPNPGVSVYDPCCGSAGLQDYVIVHELLHVSVANHGKLWKSLMRAYLGDYEVLEARLSRSAGDD